MFCLQDRLLKIVWLLRQPNVCGEFWNLSQLDDNGALSYDHFRLADSLEGSAAVFLPAGFLEFEDYSDGGFYVSAFSSVCGGADGVAELALSALDEKSAKTQGNVTRDTDALFVKTMREGVKAPRCQGLTRYAIVPYAGIVGGDGIRTHRTRYDEKVHSEQLFGRFARELVLAAGGDIESSSEDVFFAAVEKKMDVFNRVFMSRRLFTALAMVGGEAYLRDQKGISALEEDVEGMAGALIGGMLETGGMNVAALGCDASSSGFVNHSQLAHRKIRDLAFAEAAGGDVAAFDAACVRVKSSLAKDIFASNTRLMRRLTETSLRIEKLGLSALSWAYAEAFRKNKRSPPTYDTIDAGTFAHALSAESGAARLVSDYRDNAIKQSPEDVAKAEKILRGMGDATDEEHGDACKQGGGCHSGMTAKEKDDYFDACKANGGGSYPGMTAKEKADHLDACKANGGCHPGMTAKELAAHLTDAEAGGGNPPGGFDDPLLNKAFADLCQRGQIMEKHRLGSTIFKTVFVLEGGSSLEFFHMRGLVSLCVVVKPHHGRLYEVVAEGKNSARVQLFIPPSSEIVPAGRTGIPIPNSSGTADRSFSHKKMTLLALNNISWDTSKFPVTTEMEEAYDAEVATKEKMQKEKRKEMQKEKRKRRRE